MKPEFESDAYCGTCDGFVYLNGDGHGFGRGWHIGRPSGQGGCGPHTPEGESAGCGEAWGYGMSEGTSEMDALTMMRFIYGTY